jgi:alpha-D-ribose 1-methylphosphonate 5-triphosphate synthase subunit PhnG
MERREGMSVLAGADAALVAAAWGAFDNKPDYKLLRGPETGLVMIRGRTGGGGDPFNLGEATVTRATVRLDTGEVGHAYCLGRDTDKALHAALFDALLQRADTRERVLSEVIAPLSASRHADDAKRRDETAATKVDFFTMVRGED